MRTRAQADAASTIPRDAGGEATVLTNQDDATEITWEELPEYAQIACPAMIHRPDGPTGGAWIGGGGPTANIQNVVTSSAFCTAWLVDSNGAPLRLQGVRNEGCNGLCECDHLSVSSLNCWLHLLCVLGVYFTDTCTFCPADRNNGTHWPSDTRSRFTDMLIDVSTCTGGGTDGNVISYHRSGPLYIIGGSFHGAIAAKSNAKVFNVGASFINWNQTSFGCLLHGDEWRLGPDSPYKKTGGNCTDGYWYTGRTGSEITALPPSVRIPEVSVAFTSLSPGGAPPQVFQMQDATSGTVQTPAGRTEVTVRLAVAMTGKYQVLLTPTFNAGALWVPNQTSDGFSVMWERPSATVAELHWEVRSAPWAGNPTASPNTQTGLKNDDSTLQFSTPTRVFPLTGTARSYGLVYAGALCSRAADGADSSVLLGTPGVGAKNTSVLLSEDGAAKWRPCYSDRYVSHY